MKKHSDERSRAKISDIQIGDTVLIRQKKVNKWSTKFDTSPFKVVRRKGTMITGTRNGKFVTRNISHFKKIRSAIAVELSEDEDDDISDNDGQEAPTVDPIVVPERRYPCRDRTATRRYGQNVYEQ